MPENRLAGILGARYGEEVGVDKDGELCYTLVVHSVQSIMAKGGTLKQKTVVARVTAQFHEEVIKHSRRKGIDVAEAIRRALIAWLLGDFDPTTIDPDAWEDLSRKG